LRSDRGEPRAQDAGARCDPPAVNPNIIMLDMNDDKARAPAAAAAPSIASGSAGSADAPAARPR
jgi:hypothetical protein